jgi:hypothetical protein
MIAEPAQSGDSMMTHRLSPAACLLAGPHDLDRSIRQGRKRVINRATFRVVARVRFESTAATAQRRPMPPALPITPSVVYRSGRSRSSILPVRRGSRPSVASSGRIVPQVPGRCTPKSFRSRSEPGKYR